MYFIFALFYFVPQLLHKNILFFLLNLMGNGLI